MSKRVREREREPKYLSPCQQGFMVLQAALPQGSPLSLQVTPSL